MIRFLQEKPKDKIRKSQKQERKTAKTFSGRTQAGSGSLSGSKGDVRSKYNLIECKRTDHSSISIKEAWLDKIRKEAVKEGRIPVLAIEIGKRRYLIMEECHFIWSQNA